MTQYSAKDGIATAWHLQNYGSLAARGTALIIVEATAVSPEGRCSPEDLGLWNDEQAKELKKVVDFVHSQGQYIGVQLQHAGRKASGVALYLSFKDTATKEAGGWPDDIVAPSAISYAEGFPTPKELLLEDIERIENDFYSAAKRATDIGFDVIEVHGAHGFLTSQFLSPITNKRTDKYGGSFENRTRFMFEVIDGVREAIPKTTPLFFRISATEGLEYDKERFPESWSLEDTKKVALRMADEGKVDLLDVSALGNSPYQKLPAVKKAAYQAPYSLALKEVVGDKLLISAVGSINDPKLAESLLQDGLDLILVGRFFLRNPGLVWTWSDELGIRLHQANQYSWGFYGRKGKSDKAPTEKLLNLYTMK